jgi:hypothetical protein
MIEDVKEMLLGYKFYSILIPSGEHGNEPANYVYE